jgi:hypothetical protein
MKFSLTKRLLKSKVLYYLGTLLLGYVGGYIAGHSNVLSSDKVIEQQPQSSFEVVPPKKNSAMGTRLVVKRRTRRVYVYLKGKVLASYPNAVGKSGWETPLGQYQVIRMVKDPFFRNFKTNQIINPGSSNPLGKRLIVFKRGKKFDFAFHGTNQDKLIGQAISHGCIRMHNKDVIKMYELVNIGTPIIVFPLSSRDWLHCWRGINPQNLASYFPVGVPVGQ